MATRTIKTKLVIDGEKEYKEALSRVNAELRNHKAGLGELEAKYRGNANSQEALQKKLEALTAASESQKRVLAAIKDGLGNAQKELEKYTASAERAEENIQKTEKQLEELKDTTEDSSEQQKELNENIKKYYQELERCKDGQEHAAESVANWQKKQENAEASLKKYNTSIINYEGYLDEAKKSTDHCATSIDEYGRVVRKASAEENKFNKNSKDTEGAVNALAVALASSGIKSAIKDVSGALVACTEASAEFETGLKKISTIADTTSVPLLVMKEDIVNLSNETGKAVTELAESTYNAISAGVDTAKAVEFTSYATKLSVGGFTDATTSVDVLTTALNAYKMEVSEVEKVSDYLIMTQNLGKTTVNELAASVGKVIPVAAAYGVEMDNLSSAYAILTANGIATAESTTYMKAMLNELGDSGSKVSKTLIESTGMSFAQLMKKGNSLGDVMDILGESVDNNTGAFNELWSSSEAGIGALSLLGAGSEKYNNVLKQMRESAGATQEAYEKMADSTEMAQERMANAFNNLKAVVGEQLRPEMQRVYETGEDLLTWAADFVSENEYLVPTIEAVVFAMGALVIASTAYIGITKVLIPLIMELTAAFSTNPIFAVATAISVLVAAMIPFITKEGEAHKKNREYLESIRELTDEIDKQVESYEKMRESISDCANENKSMVRLLCELIDKEKKSAAENDMILELVDKLNEAVPELELKYDSMSKSLNLTTEEMEALVAAHAEFEQYKSSAEAWQGLYQDNCRAVEELEEAERKLTEAESDLVEVKAHHRESQYEDIVATSEAQQRVETYRTAVQELSQSVEENAEKMAVMRDEMNLYNIQTADLLPVHQQEIDMLLANAEALKGNQEAYSAEIETIAGVAQGYQEYADSVKAHVGTVMEEIKSLQESYQESYQTAYENIQQQIGLFDEMSVESKESIDDLIGNMNSQVEYMNQYAENIRLAMEYGVDHGIVEKLSDGSKESAAYLAAIVADGGKNIDELNAEFRRVEEGKTDFAEAVAELQTDYSEKMDALVKDTEQAVKDMAMYEESFASAVNTCRGLIDGVDSMWGEVIRKHRELAKAANKAYNDEAQIKSPSRKFKWSAEMEMEGITSGIDAREREVIKKHEELAKESILAYSEEMKSGKDLISKMDITMLSNTMNGREDISAYGNSSVERLLAQILTSMKDNIMDKANSAEQTINIYQPVKSPVEIAREIKKLRKELAFSG